MHQTGSESIFSSFQLQKTV